MLKRVGDRRHRCLARTDIINHSSELPFLKFTLPYSCSIARTRFARIVYFNVITHKGVKRFFCETCEDKVQILLMLKVLFTPEDIFVKFFRL